MDNIRERKRNGDGRSLWEMFRILNNPMIRKVYLCIGGSCVAVILLTLAVWFLEIAPMMDLANWLGDSGIFVVMILIYYLTVIGAAKIEKGKEIFDDENIVPQNYYDKVREEIERIRQKNPGSRVLWPYPDQPGEMDRQTRIMQMCVLEKRIFLGSEEEILRAFAAVDRVVSVSPGLTGLKKLRRMLILELWYRDFALKAKPEQAKKESSAERKEAAAPEKEEPIRKQEEPEKPKEPEKPTIVTLNTKWLQSVAVQFDGSWSRLVYRLSGGYGYGVMLNLLQAAANRADLVDRVWTAEMIGMPRKDLTEAYRRAGGKVKNCPELQREQGVLMAGLFDREAGMVMLELMNQTSMIRLGVPKHVEEDFRRKLDRYLEELIQAAIELDDPLLELRGRCAAAVRVNPESEEAKTLKRELGRKLPELDALYVLMDEDFNNHYPYIGMDGRMEICSCAEAAKELKKHMEEKHMGHVSVREIPGREIAAQLRSFYDIGINAFRLDNGVKPVDLWFRDFLENVEEEKLEQSNRNLRMYLLRELQYGYRIKKMDPAEKGSEWEKNLIQMMMTMRYNAYSLLGNTVLYALGNTPTEEGITWYSPKAMEKAKLCLAERKLEESALIAPGDREYRVFEQRLELRVTQLPGQSMQQALVCVFTEKAQAEAIRRKFREYGADDEIIAVTYEELRGHAVKCAGLLLDMPTYGYELYKDQFPEVDQFAWMKGTIVVNITDEKKKQENEEDQGIQESFL